MSELKADKTFVFGKECEAYIKSEADKVIAEKDKELRHQKYKRCLAMASWCEEVDLLGLEGRNRWLQDEVDNLKREIERLYRRIQ